MHIHHLNLPKYEKGEIHKFWMHIANNGIGDAIRIPIILAKGKFDGPVLGLTAAVHGNELNGIRVIQKLFRNLDVKALHGTIIGVPAVNVPGVLIQQRFFNDNADLNRIAPGKPNGNRSELYIYRFIERVIKHFDYLIDLHTASFGRINSFYVRADMNDPATARLAKLQDADLILHNEARDGSIRGIAEDVGVKAVTAELKNPHRFQKEVINEEITGIKNVMYDLNMIEGEIKAFEEKMVLCPDSYWIYTDEGGILNILPEVLSYIKKGDKIAHVESIFGEPTKSFFAPEDGIVIGKSTSPINQSGSRILHLGRKPIKLSSLTQKINI